MSSSFRRTFDRITASEARLRSDFDPVFENAAGREYAVVQSDIPIHLDQSVPAATPTLAFGERQAAIEVLRIIACIGIVWFHCKAPGALIGYAGLPALIGLSVALACVPRRSDSFADTVAKRAKRLLLPWVFWSGIYAAWRIVVNCLLGQPIENKFTTWMLLTGPSIHLWYLPFSFVFTCLAHVIRSNPISSRPIGVIATTLSVPIALVACSWWISAGPVPIPLAQWTFGFPAVCIGMALPQSRNSWDRTARSLIILLIAVLTCIAITGREDYGITVPYIIGTAFLVAAWITPIPASASIHRISSLSYGIYLVHPLFESILRRVAGIHSSPLSATLVVIISALVVTLIQRTRLRVVV